MPLASKASANYAYVLIDRGWGRVQLHGYAGEFTMEDISEMTSHAMNFELVTLPGADDCFLWKGQVA